jgi:heme-degrading monooxygenase HmoA
MSPFHLIWQFEIDRASRAAFEDVYGPSGLWVDFFRPGEGYLGTELLRDVSGADRYVTIDRWTSREAYERFRARHAAAYAALDLRCRPLTAKETFLGDGESDG